MGLIKALAQAVGGELYPCEKGQSVCPGESKRCTLYRSTETLCKPVFGKRGAYDSESCFCGAATGDAGKIRHLSRNAPQLRREHRQSCPDWKNGMHTFGWQQHSGQPELL